MLILLTFFDAHTHANSENDNHRDYIKYDINPRLVLRLEKLLGMECICNPIRLVQSLIIPALFGAHVLETKTPSLIDQRPKNPKRLSDDDVHYHMIS